MEDLPRCWLKLARCPNSLPPRYVKYPCVDFNKIKTEIESHYTLKTAPYSGEFHVYVFCCKDNDETCDSLLNDLYCTSQIDLLDTIFPKFKKLPHALKHDFCCLVYSPALISSASNTITIQSKDDLWLDFLETNLVFSEPLKLGKKYRLVGFWQSFRDLVLTRLHDKNRDIFFDLEF